MEEFVGIYTEEERKANISKEYRRLAKSLKGLEERKRVSLSKLFSELAFMAVTLEETRAIIVRDGIIEEYQNGANQRGIKKSAAVEVYDKMVNTYAKVCEQVNKNLPEDRVIDPADDILRFAVGGMK